MNATFFLSNSSTS